MYTFCKGDLSSGVHGCDFGCTKSRIKKNLKQVARGVDVGHVDRTRINILCLHLLHFLRFNFLLLQVLYLLNFNPSLFSICVDFVF